MINTDYAIDFLKSKIGKVSYSMYGSRNFSDGTCDCSGAVYTALVNAGASKMGYIPSTETMHAWLKANGYSLIAENTDWNMQRGDVVIWGRIGQSAGAGGHTGICIDNQNWLECTAYNDLGETIQNHDKRWAINGCPYFYVYRLADNAPTNDIIYALHTLGAGWLPDVTNANNTNDDGYAGTPNQRHDLLTIKLNGKYRVHTIEDGWLPWVTQSNKGDTEHGCAGIIGNTIDGVQITLNSGVAHYRTQTTLRAGWLDTCYNIDGDNYAGLYGEPLDRLQVW